MGADTPTEQDLLLPGDIEQRSSVAHNSRTGSFNDTEHGKEVVVLGDEPRRRSIFNDVGAIVLGTCIMLSLATILFLPSGSREDPRSPVPTTISQRVDRILEETPLIDGHNDLAILIRFLHKNKIYDSNFTKPFVEGGMYGHVDLPRLKEGKNGGAFWSAYAPCPKNGTDFSDENYAETVAFTYSQIDVLTRLRGAYPDVFSPPPNSSTALSAFKSHQLISPLAIEGLHQIGNSLSNLRNYYALGARYATLTHNCHNMYADAALLETPTGVIPSTPLHHGVSPAGRLLIHEMNRLGMIIDLSHVSPDTMRDVLGGSSPSASTWPGSSAPVIFSHSSAHALCPHPRNVPDSILHLVQQRNSLVMVNFSPDFVSCVANPSDPTGLPSFYAPNSTLAHVVSHIMHIGDLIGYEHVGLGSDFDGILNTPRGLEDVSKYPDLLAEMLRRGVSDTDAAMVVGGNVLRLWAEVDRVALEMQRAGVKPVEDELPALHLVSATGSE